MNSNINSTYTSPTKKFAVIALPESPLSKQGNLTGTARYVRDNAALLYNSVQEWNLQYNQGIKELIKIVTLKTPYLTDLDLNVPERIYPLGLQEICDTLKYTFEKMVFVVKKMEKVMFHFRGLKKVEDMKEVKSKTVFLTWPLQKFIDVADEIVLAYKREAEINSKVLENIAHCNNSESLTLYFALWVHQPYIDDNLEFQLEAMLKEVGHR